jgi:hypothetical protein
MLEDPSEVHPFEEELDGDAAAELCIPRSFVAEVAHPLGQVLHQGKAARALLVAQDVGGGVQDQNHGKMTRLKVEESWVEEFIKPCISILPVF